MWHEAQGTCDHCPHGGRVLRSPVPQNARGVVHCVFRASLLWGGENSPRVSSGKEKGGPRWGGLAKGFVRPPVLSDGQRPPGGLDCKGARGQAQQTGAGGVTNRRCGGSGLGVLRLPIPCGAAWGSGWGGAPSGGSCRERPRRKRMQEPRTEQKGEGGHPAPAHLPRRQGLALLAPEAPSSGPLQLDLPQEPRVLLA